MGALKMPAEHADFIVERLVFKWRYRLEELTGAEVEDLLQLSEQLQRGARLLRGLQEKREATDLERVGGIAAEYMTTMQDEADRERACLARVQAGDSDYFAGDQAEAEATTRSYAERYERQALLAREVFEAIRDGRDEVVSEVSA